MTILNHITLDALVRLPMSEIVGLPAAELARLQKEAEDALRKAKLSGCRPPEQSSDAQGGMNHDKRVD